MIKNLFLIALSLFPALRCSTKEATIPKDKLHRLLDKPVYSVSLESNAYLLPIAKESERPSKRGSIYHVLLKNKDSNRILRTITILIDDKSMNLEPEEYFHYPIYYANSTSKRFRFWHHYNTTYDIRRAADNSPIYMPVYASASVVTLAAFGIAYVASTGTAFIIGLGKGTYEFTEDILEGVIVSNEEIVLAYSDSIV